MERRRGRRRVGGKGEGRGPEGRGGEVKTQQRLISLSFSQIKLSPVRSLAL